MEIELRQQLAHLFGLSLKQRQYATHEPLVQVSDAGPTHGDGPAGQRQPSGLAIPVPISRGQMLLVFGSGVVAFCIMASLLLCPGFDPSGLDHPRGYAA